MYSIIDIDINSDINEELVEAVNKRAETSKAKKSGYDMDFSVKCH